MSSGRTPRTSTVRYCWVQGHSFPLTTEPEERYAEFDRWLTAHDAEAKAEAWDERHNSGAKEPRNPYRQEETP
jgi:hypothetical protein